jgi:hypothetical protein
MCVSLFCPPVRPCGSRPPDTRVTTTPRRTTKLTVKREARATVVKWLTGAAATTGARREQPVRTVQYYHHYAGDGTARLFLSASMYRLAGRLQAKEDDPDYHTARTQVHTSVSSPLIFPSRITNSRIFSITIQIGGSEEG